jgi:hypothetical protein
LVVLAYRRSRYSFAVAVRTAAAWCARGIVAFAALTASAALISACLTSKSSTCAGRICPPGTECVAELGGQCFISAQRDACRGLSDGDSCSYPGRSGVCSLGLCELCGNGVVDPGEACDLGPLNSDAPGSKCLTNCQFPGCGDGLPPVNGDKECERGMSGACADIGYYGTGDWVCTHYCTRDSSGCDGFCGDGIVQRQYGETCENPYAASCTEFQSPGTSHYYYGAVSCIACRENLTSCSGYCGDGKLNGMESCDGTNLGVNMFGAAMSCADIPHTPPFTTGTLACTSLCAYDTSGCQ